MDWYLPIKYKIDDPVFILGENFDRHQRWIQLLQKYFRINFETEFYALIDLYQKSGLATISDLTTTPAATLHFVREASAVLNCYKKYRMNLEIKLIKENGEPITMPDLIHDIYKQMNKKMRYLRWGAYSETYLSYLPEILSLFPNAQFIQINEDHTPSELSLLFEFEHPLDEWIFENMEYSKNFFRAKTFISSHRIVSFDSESLLVKPAESIEILIQFLQIDDPGRQLYRFIMNNIRKELTSVPPLSNQ